MARCRTTARFIEGACVLPVRNEANPAEADPRGGRAPAAIHQLPGRGSDRAPCAAGFVVRTATARSFATRPDADLPRPGRSAPCVGGGVVPQTTADLNEFIARQQPIETRGDQHVDDHTIRLER